MYRPLSVFRGILSVQRNNYRCIKEIIIQRKMGLVAVCQITSKSDKDDNYEKCSKMIEAAAEKEAKMIFLPEACDYITKNVKEIIEMSEPLEGPTMQKYMELAKKYKIWISLGGVHEKATADKVYNSHVIIDTEGIVVAVYRKVHLFDVHIPSRKLKLMESNYVMKGMEIVLPVATPIGKVGLGICYDVRFPEFARRLRKMDAEVLTFPSAFTKSTGADHWEVLMRARAIECQCFVIAAAQTGTHFPGRTSYGHAMIVDPWGNILSECKNDEEKVIFASLDREVMATIRENMPVHQHQRPDLYYLKREKTVSNEQQVYKFGSSTVRDVMVFHKTKHSIAFVNRKCVLPGHVLIAPIREVKRVQDLDEDEASDLFGAVRFVEKIIEKAYNATSSTIAIQDGEDAGQTILHVHAHVIPRKKDDFEANDDIYSRLQGHEFNPGSAFRSDEEMQEEANMLREYVKKEFNVL